MFKTLSILFILSLLFSSVNAQTIKGQVNDEAGTPLGFANVTLHRWGESGHRWVTDP